MSGHSRETTYIHIVNAAILSGLSAKQVRSFINEFVKQHHPLSEELQEKGKKFMYQIHDNCLNRPDTE